MADDKRWTPLGDELNEKQPDEGPEECPYTATEEHAMRRIRRGDKIANICLYHICEGMTGCPNTMLPPGKGAPYCARPECQEWATKPNVSSGISFDVWNLTLAGSDVHELPYIRDASWEMRDVVNKICVLRRIEQLELAPTWIGAGRSAQRMHAMIAKRGIPKFVYPYYDDRATRAAIVAGNVGALAAAYDMGCVNADKILGAAELVRIAGSVDVIGFIITHLSVRKPRVYALKIDDVGAAAVRDDSAVIVAYLVETHKWITRESAYDGVVIFDQAVSDSRFRVAKWLRDRGYPVQFPEHMGITDTCNRLVDNASENALKMLEWLHTGVPPERMPCAGRCVWMRDRK